MPTPAHALLTWSGTFGPLSAPIEEWQFSLKSDPITGATDAVLDGLAEGLKTVYDENLKSIMFADVTLTKCEVVNIGSDGKFDTNSDGSYQRGEHATNIAGTATQSNVVYPLSTALAVTLLTARPGPTGKGRFFLPFPAVNLDAGHRIGTGLFPAMVTSIAEFVRDLQLFWGPPLVVASSKGYSSTVRAIKVGRVPDTMRSRRGDLIEAYQTETILP